MDRIQRLGEAPAGRNRDDREHGSNEPASQQHAVTKFSHELKQWSGRWHLTTTPGKHIGDWVLEAAWASLISNDKPFTLRQPENRFVAPLFIPIEPFEVQPWSGDESPNKWRDRWLKAFSNYLSDHLDRGLSHLESSDDHVRIPPQRSENRWHLDLAARWQIGGEDWEAFLTREGLLEEKVSNVRDKILAVLAFIGLVVRPGMRTV